MQTNPIRSISRTSVCGLSLIAIAPLLSLASHGATRVVAWGGNGFGQSTVPSALTDVTDA